MRPARSGGWKGANYLAAQPARFTARRGMSRAQIAVARFVLVSAQRMLTRVGPYAEPKVDWLARGPDRRDLRRVQMSRRLETPVVPVPEEGEWSSTGRDRGRRLLPDVHAPTPKPLPGRWRVQTVDGGQECSEIVDEVVQDRALE